MSDLAEELVFDDEIESPEQGSSNSSDGRCLQLIRWLAVIGMILFLIAPWFTALNLVTDSGDASYSPGWFLLFFGEFGVLNAINGDFTGVGWLANPCFVLGVVGLAFGHRSFACGFSAAAALISLTSFWLKEISINEAGGMAKVVGYDSGFWIWLAGIWFNFVVALVAFLLSLRSHQRYA